jgi:hypothetical protein
MDTTYFPHVGDGISAFFSPWSAVTYRSPARFDIDETLGFFFPGAQQFPCLPIVRNGKPQK